MKKTKETKNDYFKEDLVNSVLEDFNRRRQERQNFERQWQLNLNYLAGNQYCEIMPTGEVKEEDKFYGWQSRNVFNHIAPIIDTRLAKLSRVRPSMSVRSASSEESDLKTAMISSDILNSTYSRLSVDKIINNATMWSEVCGTSFYKVTWNEKGGKKLGESDDKVIYDGDVEIRAVSPFEIFPDSLFHTELNDCKSIIYARPYSVSDIESEYGVVLNGEDIDVFTFNANSLSNNGGYKKTDVSSVVHDSVLLIEKYELPTQKYPNGRVIIVAGGTLLAVGELPYKNGGDGTRGYPFIKQNSISLTGSFFGVSLIERLIPLQRSYNAVKNRKYEFMNRVSMGVISVEDGSIDTDELVDEGLSPGKVIVYRQGSKPPQMMSVNSVPIDFAYEEERLKSEFISISGSSEVSRSTAFTQTNLSGTAIELLIEQDETRLSVTADNIKTAIREVGRHILRLFKQFATETRIMKSAGASKSVKVFYFNSSDITYDDIAFDTENELNQTPAQKKNSVLQMLQSGLLSDDEGRISQRNKSKILEILGYGSLDNAQDINNLHRNKAEKENIDMLKKDCLVDGYDDHVIHIDEHTRRILEYDVENEVNLEFKNRLNAHINEHKKYTLQTNLELNKEGI